MSARLRVLVVCLFAWVAATPSLLGQQPPLSSPPKGAIEGSIVDDVLTPVAGASITLERSGKLIATHQTDASGWFRFEGLAPDTYQIKGTLAGHASVSKTAALRSATSAMQLGLEMARDGFGIAGSSAPVDAPRALGNRAAAPSVPPSTPQSSIRMVAGSGTVFGIVTDASGGLLPGVTVTVAGPSLSQPLVAVTAASGRYQFPVVPVGTYTVTFELASFKKAVRAGVIIVTNFNAQINQKMEVGGVTEQLTVSAAPPVVDTKKTGTGSTFTGEVIEKNPTARDPWQIVNMGPGPQAGLNVGGSASGQQSSLAARGTGAPVQWNLEGGSITDLSKNGTPSYYNFDSFESADRFTLAAENSVSTFGADVDTASYTNVRRFLNAGRLPPADVVRVEEFVNYFKFDYPAPKAGRPVSITSEVGACPWAPDHRLVLVGTRAQAVEPAGPRNLVFLIDVSGSMSPEPRLPLVKTALRMFVDTLRPDDEVSIVTYAGTSGVALSPTSARHRDRIDDAIASLTAGGSTNGGAGLMLAYRLAREEFVPGGVNRIILATDGDFNVGIVGPLDLLHLIERERQSGVFLSVLGVGDDNYKDATMEMLADKGNGHYAYLDSLQEARRVLIREGGSTLETVAKDVKFQVEFNPAAVQAWRLIGYEDRLLAREDFNDDTKDGGELGAGHTVTVLYEVAPVGVPLRGTTKAGEERPQVDPLIYQQTVRTTTSETRRDEWLTVKVRYKLPEAGDSQVMSQAVRIGEPGAPGEHLPFAAAVAEFALLLRNGRPAATEWDALVSRLQAMRSTDPDGERLGFVHVVELAAGLQKLR